MTTNDDRVIAIVEHALRDMIKPLTKALLMAASRDDNEIPMQIRVYEFEDTGNGDGVQVTFRRVNPPEKPLNEG